MRKQKPKLSKKIPTPRKQQKRLKHEYEEVGTVYEGTHYDDQDDQDEYSKQVETDPLGSINTRKNKNRSKNSNKQRQKNLQEMYQQREDSIGNDRQVFNKRLNIIICTLIVVVLWALLAHAKLRTNSSTQLQQNNNIAKNLKSDIKLSQTEDSKSNQQIYLAPQISQVQQQTVKPQTIATGNVRVQPPVKEIQAIPTTTTTTTTTINTVGSKKQSVNQQRYSASTNLKDFQSDPIYISAPSQIKSIFTQMITRPEDKRASPNSIFMPTQKAYFAYRLHQNPTNDQYLKAQYYYYENKYGISKFEELMLCVVAPGRNIVKGGKYKRFVDSLQRQNYTNFRLVYVDDVSDDGSAEQLEKYVKDSAGPLAKSISSGFGYQGSFIVDRQNFNKQQDQRRLLIVKNSQRLYALANRNQGIRNFCPQQSIILDVDADDAIIGRQAFKFVNAIYHDPDTWMFNSVFIYDKSLQREVTTGPQDGVPMDVLENGTYRTSMIWKTSELRTFRTRLFNKIDEKDFKDESGVFYQWASDVFTQQPLVQLSGPKHYKHLYEIVYFYDWDFDRTTVFKRRHYRDIAFMQTPYKPLRSLDDPAEKMEGYVIPKHILDEYEKNIREGRKEAERNHRPPPF